MTSGRAIFVQVLVVLALLVFCTSCAPTEDASSCPASGYSSELLDRFPIIPDRTSYALLALIDNVYNAWRLELNDYVTDKLSSLISATLPKLYGLLQVEVTTAGLAKHLKMKLSDTSVRKFKGNTYILMSIVLEDVLDLSLKININKAHIKLEKLEMRIQIRLSPEARQIQIGLVEVPSAPQFQVRTDSMLIHKKIEQYVAKELTKQVLNYLTPNILASPYTDEASWSFTLPHIVDASRIRRDQPAPPQPAPAQPQPQRRGTIPPELVATKDDITDSDILYARKQPLRECTNFVLVTLVDFVVAAYKDEIPAYVEDMLQWVFPQHLQFIPKNLAVDVHPVYTTLFSSEISKPRPDISQIMMDFKLEGKDHHTLARLKIRGGPTITVKSLRASVNISMNPLSRQIEVSLNDMPDIEMEIKSGNDRAMPADFKPHTKWAFFLPAWKAPAEKNHLKVV